MLSRNLDQPHRALLDDFVGEVLLDVDVLGDFTSTDDVVTPVNARGVILEYRDRLLLLESKTVQKSPEIQDFTASSQC